MALLPTTVKTTPSKHHAFLLKGYSSTLSLNKAFLNLLKLLFLVFGQFLMWLVEIPMYAKSPYCLHHGEHLTLRRQIRGQK